MQYVSDFICLILCVIIREQLLSRRFRQYEAKLTDISTTSRLVKRSNTGRILLYEGGSLGEEFLTTFKHRHRISYRICWYLHGNQMSLDSSVNYSQSLLFVRDLNDCRGKRSVFHESTADSVL